MITPNNAASLTAPTTHSEYLTSGNASRLEENLMTFNDLFAQASKTYFNRSAVSFRNLSLNYQQLFTKSSQLAAFLSQEHIGVGDIVAVSIDRSIEMLTSLIAILKIGAIYLPLDPSYPQERLEFMLEDAKPKYVLVSSKYKERFKNLTSEIVIDEIWLQLDLIQDFDTNFAISSDDLAYILYTSGSTGKPKGVKISHGNLSNLLLSMLTKPGISENDRFLAITTISFDIAGVELYLPLIAGAEVVIAESEASKDGRVLIDMLKQRQITIMQATPSTWQMLIDSEWQGTFPLKALSGGEVLTKKLVDQLLTRSTALWNMYGPTETTIWSTLKKIEPNDEFISIGLPIENTQIYLADEHGTIVNDGNPGEIYIGGQGVGKGYLNRDELTNEKFINDFVSKVPGKFLYRTGDLGMKSEEGELTILGRIDQQIKIRGHRVELGEIESVVSNARGIKQAVVTFQEDSSFRKKLIAHVILDAAILSIQDHINIEHTIPLVKVPQDLTTEWKRYCATLLPAVMVPDDFVGIKRFPLTPNGKIDRNALKMLEVKTTIDHGESDLGSLSENEKLITEIWSMTLGLKYLKKTSDFFELGGQSLMAMKIMVAIEKTTGKRLPLASLFVNSTIEKMALQLENDQISKKWSCIVPVKTSGNRKPLFFVHGAGLNVLFLKSIVQHFDEDQPIYGIQALGMNEKVELPTCVEAIVRLYIDEILIIDSIGPYYIAGYSLGGLLAYEIARQLDLLGKEIKFIGVIDTYAPTEKSLDGRVDILRMIKHQIYKVPFFMRCFLNYPKDTIRYQAMVAKRRVQRLGFADAENEDFSFSDYENKISKHYVKALQDFKLSAANIQVTLFRAKKRLYYLEDGEFMGWKTYAKLGVNRFNVPGDHQTLLDIQYSRELVKVMQSAIQAV
jgi:amino acid adenylation domain-containing protein